MLHKLIRLILAVLSPLIALVMLVWLGLRETRARLGRDIPAAPGCIWIHAASVGEVNAVRPLVAAMHNAWPGRSLVVTTMTRTGLAEAGKLPGAQAFFVPADLPFVVSKVIRRMRPDMLVLVETELWPEMLLQANRHRVPVVIVNGRLSASSVRRYMRFGALWRPLVRRIAAIGAQSRRDAKRYRLLWQPRVQNTENLKFCASFPDYDRAELRRAWGLREDDFVVVFGSSREGEEALLAGAIPQLREVAPGRLRVIIAPRHMRRLGEAGAALGALDWALRSEHRDAETMLVDEMGVLVQTYALCDIAIVGGAFFVGPGGHNPVEPAYFGAPTVMGPHHKSCQDTVRILNEGGGIRVVRGDALADALVELASSSQTRKALGAAGRRVVQTNAQSVRKNLDMLQKALDASNPVW